jgi:hypothetical protein
VLCYVLARHDNLWLQFLPGIPIQNQFMSAAAQMTGQPGAAGALCSADQGV